VWVGYTNEGVYGNFGWADPRPTSIGYRGLVRFDQDLNIAWQFPLNEVIPRIDDCEALNVDVTAWVCYYTDYPLAHVDGSRVRWWGPTGVNSLSTLLVDDDRVASAQLGRWRVPVGRWRLSCGCFQRVEISNEPAASGVRTCRTGP
jgi:hypothetical protein